MTENLHVALTLAPLVALAFAAVALASRVLALLGRLGGLLSGRAGRVDQVVAVDGGGAVEWRARAVLNRSEGVVYEAAVAAAASVDPSWRVWAQVSLGEVLTTAGRTAADHEAFRFVNSKRCDVLVVDAESWPLAAIEYQGGGHARGRDWAERDAAKRIALTRAGVTLVEVPADLPRTGGREALRAFIAERLDLGVAGPAAASPRRPVTPPRGAEVRAALSLGPTSLNKQGLRGSPAARGAVHADLP